MQVRVFPTTQLFCFPHAGASAAPYLRWRRMLPASIEVVPVELPGRGRRRNEAYALTLEQVLADVERTVGVPTRPFALFGHSLGASVAFAFAQRLRARGARTPLALFASASHAPGTRIRAAGGWDDQALRGDLLRLDGTPDAILNSAELLELALPVMRADYQLAADLDQRLTRAPIAAPIHVLAGTHDDITPSALEAWRALTEGRSQVRFFAGGHFYMHEQEPQLLELLATELARALGEHPYPTNSMQGGRHGQVAES